MPKRPAVGPPGIRAPPANAMQKGRAAAPPGIRVDETLQVRPRSVERNTRASAPPPVAIHAFDEPCTVSWVLLAANASSPLSTGGMFIGEILAQFAPPMSVARMTKRPSTGSLKVNPWCESQNATPSRKRPLEESVQASVQLLPPSVVR